MSKILTQGTVLVAIGLTVYFGLLQINFMQLLKLDKSTGNVFELIGKEYIKDLKNTTTEYTDSLSIDYLDSIKNRICTANGIDKNAIRIYLFKDSEINAFAIPGNQIIVNSELIKNAKHPDEVAGVIAHEIAHLQKNHVQRRFMSQVGLYVILSTVTGTINDNIGSLLINLGSNNYSRSQEQEADDLAVNYLKKAKINPIYLAHFLSSIDEEESVNDSYSMEVFSTHPDTKKRIKKIKKQLDKKGQYTFSYDEQKFEQIQAILREDTPINYLNTDHELE